MQSEQINELATALAKAQANVSGAAKDKNNPFFNSAYADLGSVLNACREALATEGLSITQPIRDFSGNMRLVTRILHRSGQWIEDDGIPLLTEKSNMQGLGSALTYARRYGLMAAVGIAPEDDDGNAAGKTGDPVEGSKPKGDQNLWHGPLKKTALKEAVMTITGQIREIEDHDQLLAYWNSPETIAVVDQLSRDLPAWFYGTEEKGGLDSVFKDREVELAEKAAVQGEPNILAAG